MHFKWEAGLLITVVICLALLYLWYDSRALNHRLRLPGPGHGSSWDPTTDSRNDWRGNSASNLNARMRDAHHAPDGGPISPSGAPRRPARRPTATSSAPSGARRSRTSSRAPSSRRTTSCGD